MLFSMQNILASYRFKYKNVISHYQRQGDSLKLQAAFFLIDNMEGHFSPEGPSMDDFIKQVHTYTEFKGIRELAKAWKIAQEKGAIENTPDSAIIDDNYLIDNIEQAFDVWEKTPWKKDVDFNMFCHYILPYRAKDEHLCRDWRKILYSRYYPIIKDVQDVKEAFVLVRDTLLKTVALSNSYCPYTYDVLTADYIKRADCDQRCVLFLSVLRALGIPASIDVIPIWADYSVRGHSWISLVLRDGATYTVYEDEKEVKRHNVIDASRFKMRYHITPSDSCPFTVKNTKTAAKVYRIGYERINSIDSFAPRILSDPFAVDVSPEYGLQSKITIKAKTQQKCYLCVFKSGNNWVPIADATPINGEVTFHNIGQPVVYLVAVLNGKELKPLSEPFLVDEDGICKKFEADTSSRENITLHRKYPLYSYITDLWGYMKGGVFEASNKSDFSDAVELGKIERMPYGETFIKVERQERFRYLRYRSPANNRTAMAELSFYSLDSLGQKKMLKGVPIYQGVDSVKVHLAFDRNLATNATARDVGYWIGLDLGDGNQQSISQIMFAPTSDTNNIEADHLYELYYFDTKWHLLGRQLSDSQSLTFDNIPHGALLLLKDKTKGQEERIFEYCNNSQIWY